MKKHVKILDKNKNHIKEEILRLKIETEMLKEKARIDNFMPSGRDLFLQWKKKKKKENYIYDFIGFVKQLKIALKSVASSKLIMILLLIR